VAKNIPKKKKKKKDRLKERENVQTPLPALPEPPSVLSDIETRKKVLNILGQVAIVFLIVIAMIWGKAYYSQQEFYYDGEKALNEKNYKDAVTGYEWAIRMYTPLSGKVKDSCEKIWFIAEEYEKRGQLDWALIAYRSLRSSIYGIKSFYRPFDEWIPKTDEKIKMILAIQKDLEKRNSARLRGAN